MAVQRKISFRVGLKLLTASLAAEVISLSFVLNVAGCPGGLDVHAADRILLQLLGRANLYRGSPDLHHAGHAASSVGGREVFFRIATKLIGTTARAEVVEFALVLHGGRCMSRIHTHPANWIFSQL